MEESVLDKIEVQRLQLEEHISKLRKSLRHWQTLELDYEGLKEEFQTLPGDASRENCLQIGRDFKAVLVDERDLQSLLNDAKGAHRRPQQLADLLSKRVDYVARNVDSVRKQLSEAEKKRNALLLAEEPEHRDDAGLPFTEITEELDEHGRVISSKVQRTDDSAPKLIDVLKKAGVSGLETSQGTIKLVEVPSSERATAGSTTNTSVHSDKGNHSQHQSADLDASKEALAQLPADKGVNTGRFSNPNDSEADAALRQEMLDYGLGEVGAIVAELDLEENVSDVSYDEDGDNLSIDSENDDQDEDDELDETSEDETGKIKSLRVSSKYRRRMEELQKKLGMQDLQNLGPTPDLSSHLQTQLDQLPPGEAARKAALARHKAAAKSAMKGTDQESEQSVRKKRKQVAFAESLDIADTADETRRPSSGPKNKQVNPVGDNIVERSEISQASDAAPASVSSPSAKVSQFKSARRATPQTPMFPPPMEFPEPPKQPIPEGPQDKIISDTLIERPSSKAHNASLAPDPLEIDDEIHRREIAMEYHKLRNRKVHAQGGFVGDGEADNYGDEIVPDPIVDEDTGKIRKVSRFKAARLKP